MTVTIFILVTWLFFRVTNLLSHMLVFHVPSVIFGTPCDEGVNWFGMHDIGKAFYPGTAKKHIFFVCFVQGKFHCI